MIATAAAAGQMPLAAWVSILVGLAGVAVLLLKAGQRFGAMNEHLSEQDETLARQDKALAAQDAVLSAQGRALAQLRQQLEDLKP